MSLDVVKKYYNKAKIFDYFLVSVLSKDISDSAKLALMVKGYELLLKQKRDLMVLGNVSKVSKVKSKIISSSKKRSYKHENQESLFALASGTSEKFYSSKEWKEIRFDFLSQCQDKKCKNCNSANDLQVDHIKPRYIYPELAFEYKNLQILCKPCNEGKGIKAKTYKIRKQ